MKIISGELNDTIDATEEETISNLHDRDANSRLACQIMLDEKINNMTFKVLSDGF